MLRLCEEYLSSIPMCMLVAEIERRKTQESTPEDDMGWKVQAKPNEGIQADKDEGAKADKYVGAEEKRVQCAGAKKRKHDPWVGWKVARQGKWDGYELINCGGNMEWLQASIGSELYTYFNGKHYYLKVASGMHPSAWKEYQLDEIPGMYVPESLEMVPFPPVLADFYVPDED